MASRFLVPLSGRSLGRRTPSIFDLHREVNSLFDDVFRQLDAGGRSEGVGSGAIMSAPRIDVHETEEGLALTAELAGVEQNNVDIQLDEDVLTIRGEKRNERKDAKAHVVERSYGTFERSVQLPFAPDPEKVEASFHNGVLTIQVPRTQQQNRSRRIEIGGRQSGQGQQSSAGQTEQEQAGRSSAQQAEAAGTAQQEGSRENTGATGQSPGGEAQSGGGRSAFFGSESGSAAGEADVANDQASSKQTEGTDQSGGETS